MDQKPDTQVTASDICDALGRKAIADRIGVGLTAVSNASADGGFPAKWFAVLREMCAECGLDCPEHLFNFVRPSAKRFSANESVPDQLREAS